MKDESQVEGFRAAVRAIELQRRLLVEANAAESVVEALSAIVRLLNRLSANEIIELRTKPEHKLVRRKALKFCPPIDVSKMDVDSVLKLVADLSIPRRLLEEIAVQRFHFPKGSLRSLANLEILRDRLVTMAENERSHRTISSVAKRSGR